MPKLQKPSVSNATVSTAKAKEQRAVHTRQSILAAAVASVPLEASAPHGRTTRSSGRRTAATPSNTNSNVPIRNDINSRRTTRAEIVAASATTPPEQGINRGSANNGVWSQCGQTPLSNITPLIAEPVIARFTLKPVQARLSLSSVRSDSDSDDENWPPLPTSQIPFHVGETIELLDHGKWWAVVVVTVTEGKFVDVKLSDFEHKSQPHKREKDQCLLCRTGTLDCGRAVLLCADCEGECHLSCSGLKRVPKGLWLCSDCKLSRMPTESKPIRVAVSNLSVLRALGTGSTGGRTTTRRSEYPKAGKTESLSSLDSLQQLTIGNVPRTRSRR
jgi:hypothetical protein